MEQASDVTWKLIPFEDLTVHELYQITILRERVFVVEQDCVYLDADGADPDCFHLCGYHQDALVAYLRVVPPGLKYANAASVGRVVTAPEARGMSLGKTLMKQGLEATERLYPHHDIKISGQCYLERFYRNLGFEAQGETYLEDGIPHVAMLRRRTTEEEA
ncbi:GNAT family N-acetyltransferase [Acanthopleuribacter pedis]|uniref:GNAT family N-acetyltransferase n=1 Tax=Acanthopleuribacter pedis TaxID=442870 RepID=A0A8J7QFR7_9BACT|nr:GNAT family N-acetyltransferase [Acanthopleuribacter pedis]MBO1319130.1 GNAT family N-acetyltransferase [Acanthopleuribacter pedis]